MRKEVKDVMAYVKLAINPEDNLSLMRTINQPTRGIGAESQIKLRAWAEGQGLTLGQALFPEYKVRSRRSFCIWLSVDMSSECAHSATRANAILLAAQGIAG